MLNFIISFNPNFDTTYLKKTCTSASNYKQNEQNKNHEKRLYCFNIFHPSNTKYLCYSYKKVFWLIIARGLYGK